MRALSPHAFASMSKARWRALSVAVAAGIAGSAMLVIPALAQTGNAAPVANDDAYAIVQNTATVLAVLGNDTDPDSDALSVQSVTAPAHGTATLGGGTLTYTPVAAYTGADTFTYTVSDGQGNVDTATVNLVVAATIGVPNAQDDSLTAPMNTATSFNVLANDTDPDGQTLTITAVSTPAHGTAAIVAGTSITYTPVTGYTGADSFSYTASDGFGSTDIATVTVNVTTTTGDAPVAQNDAFNVRVNTSTVLTVLANDSDPNGDDLTITSLTTPAHGTATITGSAERVTYVPTTGYLGADAFSYTISDGNGHTATGTVAVVVIAEDALLARNDRASTKVDRAKTISVLSNDDASGDGDGDDDDDDALTVTAVTAPAHGTATITGDAKKVTYTPAAGYVGGDVFTYTVTETGGGTASATVTMTVKPASHDDDDDDDDFDKDDCKDGQWVDLGFRNQGFCIATANHGFMHNGRPLFPDGIFPNGIFPNGLFPNGVFGDEDEDDEDDDSAVTRRGNHSGDDSDDDSDARDRIEKANRRARLNGLGAQIRESVRASLGDIDDDRDNGKRGRRRGRD